MMQQDAEKNGQDVIINLSSSQTDNLNQLLSEPSSYAEDSQQSFSHVPCLQMNNENRDTTQAYRPEDALVLPARDLPPHLDNMEPVTVGMRVCFIITAIIYLILGAGVFGIEIALMMYSFSTFYRGIWTGNLMLAIAICMLVAAGRRSQYVHFIKSLLAFNMVSITLGILLSGVEMVVMQPCAVRESYTCEAPSGKTLRLAIISVLSFAIVYNTFSIAFIQYFFMD